MRYFMIDIDLPKVFDQDFIDLLPYQKEFVDKMIKKGTIVNYSLSFDRTKLWVVIMAGSFEEVKKIIGTFPIFCYIKFKINGLLMHEVGTRVPQFWLN